LTIWPKIVVVPSDIAMQAMPTIGRCNELRIEDAQGDFGEKSEATQGYQREEQLFTPTELPLASGLVV
jgi:hypothetical protein